jgi:hypothetical protein
MEELFSMWSVTKHYKQRTKVSGHQDLLTDWLTDRQPQCDFDFDFDFNSSDDEESWEEVSNLRQ